MNRVIAQKLLNKTAMDYESIAKDFSVTRFALWPEFGEFLKFIKNGDAVLDLGCGNGRLYELFEGLSTRLNNSAKGRIAPEAHLTGSIDYLGLDRSANLISAAKERWRGSGAKFGIGDVLDMNFKNEFDAVFFIAVLHHIPNEELRLEALKKIYVSLKPGGKFFMTNWMLWQKKYLSYIVKYTVLKMIGKNKMDFGDILLPWKANGEKEYGKSEDITRYYHAFTKREILRLAKLAGFKIVKSWKSDRNYVMICEK
jgi:SAM-dependent methyltransferase